MWIVRLAEVPVISKLYVAAGQPDWPLPQSDRDRLPIVSAYIGPALMRSTPQKTVNITHPNRVIIEHFSLCGQHTLSALHHGNEHLGYHIF